MPGSRALYRPEKAARIDAQVLESIVEIEQKLIDGITENEQTIFFSVIDRMSCNLDN